MQYDPSNTAVFTQQRLRGQKSVEQVVFLSLDNRVVDNSIFYVVPSSHELFSYGSSKPGSGGIKRLNNLARILNPILIFCPFF